MEKHTTIDEYLKTVADDTRKVLQEMRETIQKEAPEAIEAMSYGMPTFKYNGKNLVHFAGWKDHIAVYPTPSNLESEIPEVAKFRTGKGTLQFLLHEPLPFDLIRKIVQFRVKEMTKK